MPLNPSQIARHFFDGDQPRPQWFAKIGKYSVKGWVAGDDEVRTGGKRNTRVSAVVGQVRLSYVLADDGSGVLQSYEHYPLAVRLRSGDVVLNDADHLPSMTTMRQWHHANGAAEAYAARAGKSVTYAPLTELVQLATDITPLVAAPARFAHGYQADLPVGTEMCSDCKGRKRKRGEDYCLRCDGCGWVPISPGKLRTLQTALRATRRHRATRPHGGCAAAGHCIEPVSDDEKCSTA